MPFTEEKLSIFAVSKTVYIRNVIEVLKDFDWLYEQKKKKLKVSVLFEYY